MYQNLLPDLAEQRIADRRREAAAVLRGVAADKARSVPAVSRARRRGLLRGRRAAACQNS